jgi:hypothetical protein
VVVVIVVYVVWCMVYGVMVCCDSGVWCLVKRDVCGGVVWCVLCGVVCGNVVVCVVCGVENTDIHTRSNKRKKNNLITKEKTVVKTKGLQQSESDNIKHVANYQNFCIDVVEEKT